ncbi:hypothetical protein Gohar_010225 [Gossypium harknessii]|uniref:Uncharacterized protein n=1 Tax=Gossypium harknessii TaxID=34285 RepID=A0A7J9GQ65_9ROSI|nr:hypothetical protein [Gossypium harknessii]
MDQKWKPKPRPVPFSKEQIGRVIQAI